jgi:hypothetical protein
MNLDTVIEKFVNETSIAPKENGGKETQTSKLIKTIGMVQFMTMVKAELQKMEPNLSPDEIGNKIDAGEIDLNLVVQNANQRMNGKDENNNEIEK